MSGLYDGRGQNCSSKIFFGIVLGLTFLIRTMAFDLVVKLSLSLFLSTTYISQSLNLSLSLRDGDRADTIITLPPPNHPQQIF